MSTTHTITGSIIGVGAAKKVSAVRWAVAKEIVTAWIITIPASGLLAALFYWLIRVVELIRPRRSRGSPRPRGAIRRQRLPPPARR